PQLSRHPGKSSILPYTTRFRSGVGEKEKPPPPGGSRGLRRRSVLSPLREEAEGVLQQARREGVVVGVGLRRERLVVCIFRRSRRSEEHTSELQSRANLVCRLLL